MGQDAFLKLKDIKGDATDANHKDEIEINSFSLSAGISEAWDQKSEEGERLKVSKIEAISISKKFDRASAKLLDAASKNSPLETSYIYFCRPSGDLGTSSGLETYMTFTLFGTNIDSYSLNGGGGYPTESFTLRFSKIKWQLKDSSGGTAGEGEWSQPGFD